MNFEFIPTPIIILINVIPFEQYAIGSLEMRDKGEKVFKLMRLKRLQEVRQQERQIALERNAQYRDKINDHKKCKKDFALTAKRNEMIQHHDNLLHSWQKSLVDAGNAQREAKENTVDTINRLRKNQSVAIQKKAACVHRQREALKQIELEKDDQAVAAEERTRRLTARRELIASDREDAKATAEARKAKEELIERRKIAAMNAYGGPQIIDQPIVERSSGGSSQQKSASVVQTRIIRETTRADMSAITNKATDEENVVVKRLMKRCIDELRNKNKALLRARAARRSTAAAHNAEALEAEFATLLAFDRSSQRTYRVKNAASIPANEEEPVILESFENVFLSDKIKDVALIADDEDSEDYDSADDDLDSLAEKIPRPPLRRSAQSSQAESRTMATGVVSNAQFSNTIPIEPKKKSPPIRERVVVKPFPKKRTPGASFSADVDEELSTVPAVSIPTVVSIPSHTGTVGSVSATWVPTPLWQKVAGATRGYCLEGSFNTASSLGVDGEYFVDGEEVEVESDDELRTSRAVSNAGPADFNDSLNSTSGMFQDRDVDLDDMLGSSTIPDADRDDLEIETTRGSASSFSPVLSIRNHLSPARYSLKDHSDIISLQLQLRVSVSPDHYEVRECTRCILDNFLLTHFHTNPVQVAEKGVVDASWDHRNDDPNDSFDGRNRKGSNLFESLEGSHASTVNARHDMAHMAPFKDYGCDETTLSASFADSLPFSYDDAVFMPAESREESPSSKSYEYESPPRDDSLKSSSFHSSIPPSIASTTSVASATRLTVRLAAAGGGDGLAPAQSVSFESLFIEDSEDEDDYDSEDDESERRDLIEYEVFGAERSPEDGDDDDSDDDDSNSESILRSGSEKERSGNARGGDFTFSTANLRDATLGSSGSCSLSDDEDVTMYTPVPHPPQSTWEGGLGTFSRRPFKLVPSPTAALTSADVSNDGHSPGLVDLLGLSRRSEIDKSSLQEVFSTRSSASVASVDQASTTSSNDLNISELLGLNREEVWGNESYVSNDDSDGPLYYDKMDAGDADDDERYNSLRYSNPDMRDSTSIVGAYDDFEPSDLGDEGAGARIEAEIAEMRARLLEAVHNTLSASKTLSSKSSPQSSPFFSFHNQTGIQSSSSVSTADTEFMMDTLRGSSDSISQHSMEDSRISGGLLSSDKLTSGNLSSGLSGGDMSSSSNVIGGDLEFSACVSENAAASLSNYSLDL